MITRALTGSFLFIAFSILITPLALSQDETSPEADTPDAAISDTTVAEKPDEEKLSPQMQTLRDAVRRTLAAHKSQYFSLDTNSVTDILDYCYGAGVAATVIPPSGEGRYNALGCLCYNYPCGGYRPMALQNDLPTALVGYGKQTDPGQMIAVLALAGVKSDFAIKLDGKALTVADLVKSEQLACRTGEDMSLRLTGLSKYCDDDQSWKNSLGETWSLEKMIESEISRKADKMTDASTRRLVGLSFALEQRRQREEPIEGVYARLEKLLSEYRDFVIKLQNTNGSWSPYYFAYRGADKNHYAALRSSGRVLEWLVMATPADKMDDPQLVKAVTYVSSCMNLERYAGNFSTLPTAEIANAAHAMRALSLYNEKAFPEVKEKLKEEVEEKSSPDTEQE